MSAKVNPEGATGAGAVPKEEEISNAERVQLVQSSFETLKPVAEKFVQDFYDNLLTSHPEMAPLFGGTDMRKQHAKLISALVMLVQDLGDIDVVKPKLLALGYGIM
jgi:nitric oxide dioxygenase